MSSCVKFAHLATLSSLNFLLYASFSFSFASGCVSLRLTDASLSVSFLAFGLGSCNTPSRFRFVASASFAGSNSFCVLKFVKNSFPSRKIFDGSDELSAGCRLLVLKCRSGCSDCSCCVWFLCASEKKVRRRKFSSKVKLHLCCWYFGFCVCFNCSGFST